MMKRYTADGMRVIGLFEDGMFRFRIGLKGAGDDSLHILGQGPSLVEALDDALQSAIIVEEDWRREIGE